MTQESLRAFRALLVLVGLVIALATSNAQNQLPSAAPIANAKTNAPATGAALAVIPPLPPPSASARDLFSRYKDRLVQVRVLLNSANEQSSLGSGFLVRDDGVKGAWVLTNYHVISSLAIDPQKYRIELRGTNDVRVKAKLVALDVRHDLAVLHIAASSESVKGALPWNTFSLRDAPLPQGNKIFSLGNPLELGFLISEGIFNGLVESRLYDQMLFSGALNSGMSGGPAIDEQGQVVGVNVATRRDGEQLSFLVPVRYARDLLDRAWKEPASPNWRSEIAKQLLVHQDLLINQVFGAPGAAKEKLGFTSQTLGSRAVPTLGSGLTKCWANALDGDTLRYQRDTLDCNLRSSLYVRGSIQTGTMSLQHVLLQNQKLATAQFLNLENTSYISSGWSRTLRELTSNECQSSYLQPGAQVYRVSVCLRAYRKFEDIYDFTVLATQVDDASQRLTSTFTLQGFSYLNAQRLTRLFLERLQ